MPLIANITVEICEVAAGGGNSMLGQLQADVGGLGQAQVPHVIPIAQRLQVPRDSEVIPAATDATVTLANINTALINAVFTLAGASGTPLITPAMIAQIQGWSSGGT